MKIKFTIYLREIKSVSFSNQIKLILFDAELLFLLTATAIYFEKFRDYHFTFFVYL